MKFLANLFTLMLLFSTVAHAAKIAVTPFELPRTSTIELQDAETKRFYDIHIQLPPNYNANKTYPVVYMTDSPYTFPIVTGAARFPVNFKKIESLIFVGISWENGYSPALSRQRDYTPTTSSPGFKDPSGQADAHLSFIRNTVIDYVEKKYNADSNQRTYIGNSFGGLFGAYIFLTSPATFNNYILGSPSLWWDNRYLFKLESTTRKSLENVNAKVFIAVGANEVVTPGKRGHDMVGDAQNFYAKLNEQNIENLTLKLHVIDSANHATAFPTSAIQGLWWLFKREN